MTVFRISTSLENILLYPKIAAPIIPNTEKSIGIPSLPIEAAPVPIIVWSKRDYSRTKSSLLSW